MGERSTESLIQGLASDLQPVARTPRVRTMVAIVLAAFAAAVAVGGLLGAPLPFRSGGVPWGDPVHSALLASLVLSAAGGILAALAGAVPGRGQAAGRGVGLAAAGIGVAVLAALSVSVLGHGVEASLPIASSLGCGGRASALGLVPALVLAFLLSRAHERRPWLGAARAAAGALALGAVVVHASCSEGGAFHQLLGHWALPGAAALVLAFPLSLAIRRSFR